MFTIDPEISNKASTTFYKLGCLKIVDWNGLYWKTNFDQNIYYYGKCEHGGEVIYFNEGES